jgi:DNA polymerase III subunit gamma/tau
MAVSLYRKWRPQTFSEMSAQDHVSRTLRGALTNDRLAHAFVFAGTRGTGKTTMARILARAVNCVNLKDGEPCGKCGLCVSFLEGRAIDLVEIDAASNRGIDDIRELRESIRFSPSEATKKVYIIDEAHMLTKEAFNALLKTLEEPPEYAMFILATTEAERLPETILSRCQRFDFRPVPGSYLKERVAMIAGKEGVSIDEGALDLIVRASGGSFRDAISLLDQLAAVDSTITTASASQMLGLSDSEFVSGLTRRILAGDATAALRTVREFTAAGGDVSRLNRQLIEYFRALLLHKLLPESESAVTEPMIAEISADYDLRQLSTAIQTLRAGEEQGIDSLPSLGLELSIVSLSLPQLPTEPPVGAEAEKTISQPAKPAAQTQKSEPDPVYKKEVSAAPTPSKESVVEPEVVVARTAQESAKSPSVELSQISEAWPQILNGIKPYNHSIAAFLLVCKPTDIVGGRLILAFPYKFHRERISELRNRQIVEKVIEDVVGARLQVDCVLAEQGTLAEQIVQTEPAESDDLIDTALEIFGGRVVS